MNIDTRQVWKKSAASQETIARLAGVARSTVSMALSDDPSIAEHTRREIKRIAADVNYHPHSNLGARLMAAQRTGRSMPLSTLGVIWDTLPDAGYTPYHKSFMMALLNGMVDACREINHSLLVIGAPRNQAQASGLFAQLDGLVVPFAVAGIDSLMKEYGKPIVGIQNRSPDVASIEIDNQEAVRLAFRYLHDRGHRRIGWISPSLSPVPALRWAGYCECLKEAGLPYNAHYVLSETEALMEFQGGIALRKLWSHSDRPTAIVVYNDLMALSVLRTAQDLGVRVPEDLSLVSIDDIPEASLSVPALTTVAIGIEQLGGQAVRLLEEFVRTGTYRAEKVQLRNFVLKERATVAADVEG